MALGRYHVVLTWSSIIYAGGYCNNYYYRRNTITDITGFYRDSWTCHFEHYYTSLAILIK